MAYTYDIASRYTSTSAVVWHEPVTRRIADLARKGMSEAGQKVAYLAKAIAPQKTGLLRSGIRVVADDWDTVLIGVTTVPYAIFVELGTRKMAPRAYLRKALDIPMITETVKDYIKANM